MQYLMLFTCLAYLKTELFSNLYLNNQVWHDYRILDEQNVKLEICIVKE